MPAAARATRRKRSRAMASSAALRIILMATWRPRRRSSASWTTPMPPLPSVRTSSYREASSVTEDMAIRSTLRDLAPRGNAKHGRNRRPRSTASWSADQSGTIVPMTDFNGISTRLTRALDLSQPPVAISLIDSISPDDRKWTGPSPAGCRFWQEGMQGGFVTDARDHDSCAIGIHTHNLEGTAATDADLAQALGVFAELTYVRKEDIAQIPTMSRRARFAKYEPLADCGAAPDVALLFVRANQALIATEAAQQIDGGATPALGRPACAVVPQAANLGRAALSLGCCGAREYLDVLSDEVAIFAIPGPKLEAFAERIEALAKANRILTQFHDIRKRQVASHENPSVS